VEELAENVGGLILAAIVHENYLPGFLGLLQRVAQPSSQLGKILLLIVDGDDD
jgi:hypothetical protein